MCKKITMEEILKEKDINGIVILNYKYGIEKFKKTILSLFYENNTSIVDSIEYIPKDNVIDIIIRKKDIPKDDVSQIKYECLSSYLVECRAATDLSRYVLSLQNPNKQNKERIMTLFERELLLFTEIFENKKFIGNSMYISLGESNRLKINFVTSGFANIYDNLKLTIIDKTNGVIDKTYLKFENIWNAQNTKGSYKSPHIWKVDDKVFWYDYKPTPRDYELITEQIDEYATLFSDEQTLTFNTSQSM